jgi:tight adherence protein C
MAVILLTGLLVAAAVGLVLLPAPAPAADGPTGSSPAEWLARYMAGTNVARDLPLSGLPWTLEEVAARKVRLVLIALGAWVVLTLIGSSTMGLVALAAAVWAFKGPDLEITRRAAARRGAVQKEMPSFLFTMAILTEAGMHLLPAMEHYCRSNDGILSGELKQTLTEIQLGQPPALAMMETAQYLNVRDFTLFVGALVQTLERGGDGLAKLLRMQAEASWDKRKRNAQELGHKASAKLFLPLALFVLPAIIAIAIGPAAINFFQGFLN